MSLCLNYSCGSLLKFSIFLNFFRFQKACIKYGLADVDLFQTTDLWDRKNIALVTQTIFAVARSCYKHPEFQGPFLGPRPAEENRRDFSEEQVRICANLNI